MREHPQNPHGVLVRCSGEGCTKELHIPKEEIVWRINPKPIYCSTACLNR